MVFKILPSQCQAFFNDTNVCYNKELVYDVYLNYCTFHKKYMEYKSDIKMELTTMYYHEQRNISPTQICQVWR